MSDQPLSFPMNPEEYRRYCRAWLSYLHMTQRERHDFLTPFVCEHLRVGIIRWPSCWPEVELWFEDDVDVFVRAMEDAEPKFSEQRRQAEETRRAIFNSRLEARARANDPERRTH